MKLPQLFYFIFSISTLVNAQKDPLLALNPEAQEKWVDSVYNSLSLKQKIGQLFMVDAFSDKGKAEQARLQKLVEEQQIGGIIFSKGGPVRQAKMHNALQKKSNIPMLIAMDAEWGLSMRLDSTYAFPWNMTLGAIQNKDLIKETGTQIGEHCKRLGVHINFAPVVDINTNPINPIIGNRSFGETKENVTSKGIDFMHGMQSSGVLASGKHFPGHGDTDKDSHKTLPSISFPKDRIENVELFPFKKLIKEGLASVMVAHLNIPSLIDKKGLPSSLSKQIVTDLLIDKLKFKGLIFTDALNMKGAANFDEPGDIDLAAFKAGNDVLLISENVPKAVAKIEKAINKGKVTEERLEVSVKKILKAKYKVGLNNYKPINLNKLYDDLNAIENDVLYEKLAENAITLLKNENTLPFEKLELKKVAYVPMGDADGEDFFNQLKLYTSVTKVNVNKITDINKLAEYNRVIVGFHKSNKNPWQSYKFTRAEKELLSAIAVDKNTTLVAFTKPYAFNDLEAINYLSGVVMAYQNSKIFQEKAAQALFGGIPIKGKLPVSTGTYFKEGDGFFLKNNERLSYGLPEQVGMSSAILSKIDSIASYCLDKKMTPGLQILVARNGKVVYNKSMGYQTYEKQIPITNESIYDLASLTKILASVPLLMQLKELGVFKITDRLKDLLPELKGTNKADIKIVDALTHQGRLKPWIPFYVSTLDSTQKPSKAYYRDKLDDDFSTKVAKDLYVRDDIKDTIFQEIVDSDLRSKKTYKYSDLAYYILQRYIEGYYKSSMHEVTKNFIYNPIGANYTGYLPLNRFYEDEIVPTEVDKQFRNQEVRGYVHDQGAAMLGGIGGHAGLFANANDVAKIMQMYIQNGKYGYTKFFKPKTVESFNTCYFCKEKNRRGVGFDKPQLSVSGPTCGCVSMKSFGHSGFTGTYTWADPEEKIVYVFLSNRTYPDSGNRLLIRENIRTKIQEIIYDAIEMPLEDLVEDEKIIELK